MLVLSDYLTPRGDGMEIGVFAQVPNAFLWRFIRCLLVRSLYPGEQLGGWLDENAKIGGKPVMTLLDSLI